MGLPSFITGNDLPLCHDPHPGFIFSSEPEFRFISRTITGQIIIYRIFRLPDVIGVDPFLPFFKDTGKFAGFIAGHGIVTVVKKLLSGLEIPIPYALIGNRHGQFKTLFALLQGLLCQFALGDIDGKLKPYVPAVRPLYHAVDDGKIPVKSQIMIFPPVRRRFMLQDDPVGTKFTR